jgi:hypothetical protein
VKPSKKLDLRVLFPIAAGSLGLLVAALMARNDAFAAFLIAISGAALVVSGFWLWSK